MAASPNRLLARKFRRECLELRSVQPRPTFLSKLFHVKQHIRKNVMAHNLPFAGCARCPISRRGFLTRSSMFAAAVGAGFAAPLSSPGAISKVRVRIVFALHASTQDRPDWPNKGFRFGPEMERITGRLRSECDEIEFLTSTASGEEDAKEILARDTASGGVDGYLVYQMNCWNRVVHTYAASGKPVLFADFQFGGSGGFLVYNAAFLRGNASNVGFVASSRIADVVKAVRCFGLLRKGGTASDFVAATAQVRSECTPAGKKSKGKSDDLRCLSAEDCLKQFKTCKVLAVRDQTKGPAGESMGIQIEHVPFAELNDAWKTADPDEAQEVADRWQKTADKVEAVPRETLVTSAAMYLAQKAVMKKHGAQGITINCLGGFYGGHIQAYPCLGFHQLLNEGLVGGCECDVRSAVTMLAGTIMTQGRPGYISDPVIDTSKRRIIYAHCVASNKAFGPTGKVNGFDILTHSEDRQGASVRSRLPLGYITTTVEFEQSRKQVLFHRGLAVANDPDDRACRTKLCAEPIGDIEKLFREWDQWSWHRVTFYGDLKEPVYALADALGWKVVEEA